MKRALVLFLRCAPLCAVAACTLGTGPSALDERVAVWRLEEADQEARQDTDMARDDQDRARADAVAETGRRQADAVLDGQNAARQRARAALLPKMHGCLANNVHRLAGAAPTESQVADAVLAACRPEIAAMARTVELVHVASSGLERDMTIRLRPQIMRMLYAERARMNAHPAL